jgi:hypothetical protein
LHKKYVIFVFLLLLIIPLSFAADNETALTVDSEDSLAVPNSGDVLKASNDYYFNASAEDDGDGSIDNPFKYLTADKIKANCNIHLANGEYQYLISRSLAVMAPLLVTGGCLIMMFLSRRTVYPWIISIFTLVLPILIWFTNVFPA